MQPDDKLCYCFHVSLRKVQNFVRIHQPRVASQLSECGSAGTGCGWCVPFLKRCFEAGQAARDAGIELSAEDYAQQRADYVRAGKGKPPAGATPIGD
ncbi:MAG: (2Fe-2S)-binding protein [Planctomycetaceae bacterium]|nr:(2Fe-2S)-binding protein [Planctomycetaceae bacterium]